MKVHGNFKKSIPVVLGILAFLGVVRLFRAAWLDSMDFVVYWTAARAWLTGVPQSNPYLFDATIRGFVFKYPPWILPLFVPFGFMPYDLARMAWAALELGCIVYALKWLFEAGVRPAVLWVSGFLFWWIWLGHFYAGQFTLVLLAAALWVFPQTRAQKSAQNLTEDLKQAFVVLLFSAKAFSVLSLLGISKKLLRPRVILSVLGLIGVLGGVIWSRIPNLTPLQLLQDWSAAASSGGSELGERIIRGQMNHGLTAGVLRALQVPSTQTHLDLWVALGLFSLLAPLWMWLSKKTKLTDPESWSGWLALGLITHPLAWHHSFVLAFPLGAFALERAVVSRKRAWVLAALLGFICIGILIPNIFGLAWVTPLENLSIKSWGVVLLGTVLLRARV